METTAATPVLTDADVTLLADIANGFSTVLHYDRLDDLRKRLRTVIATLPAMELADVQASLNQARAQNDTLYRKLRTALDATNVFQVIAVGERLTIILMNGRILERTGEYPNARWIEAEAIPETRAALVRAAIAEHPQMSVAQ